MKKQKKKQKEVKKRPIKTWVIVLILLALVLIFFHKVLSPSRMIYGSDQLISGYMFKVFSANYIKTHLSFPMWNPYIFGGFPFIAAFHGDALYYTWILRLFLPVHLVMAYIYIIHVFLAGLGMFFFLKCLRISKYGALTMSIAYMFTGVLVTAPVYGGADGRAIIISFLPWVLFFLHKGLEKRRLVYFLGGSIVIGLSILSPNVQMSYYLLMAAFLYLLFKLYFIYRDEKRIGSPLRLFGFFWLMVILGLLISAVQFLPAYTYLPFSPRAGAGRGYSFATSWSFPPLELFDLLTPHFSGILDNYWGLNYFKLGTEYLGILPLVLAIVGVAFYWKRRETKFFFGLMIFALIMAFGGYTPLYKIPYHIVPLLKKFRAPSIIFYLASFSICTLGALGIDLIIQKRSREETKKLINGLWIIVGVIFFIALIFYFGKEGMISSLQRFIEPRLLSQYGPKTVSQKIANLSQNYSHLVGGLWKAFLLTSINAILLGLLVKRKIKPPTWILLVVPVLLFDLWSVDFLYLKTVEHPKYFYAKDEVVNFLEKDKSLYRVFPFQWAGIDLYRHDDYLMLYNIQSVGGYHGNQLRRYQEFIGSPQTIMFQNPKNLYYQNFLDLLNVKYIITTKLPEDLSPYPEDARRLIESIKSFFARPNFKEVFASQRYAIYENKSCLPRAFLVPEYRIISEERKILALLRDSLFDPKKTAILEERLNLPLPLTPEKVGRCKIVSYDPNRIEIKAELIRPGILVLSENYYPRWRAYVDGRETKIYRCDYTFRAVFLPEGRHNIEFIYDKKYFNLGKLVTFLSLGVIIIGILLCISFERKRRRIST